MDYPVWDMTLGGGLLMAVVAIPHVIVAHFAIGGGLVIAVTETLAVARGDAAYRELARRASWMLILVSTVFGAISGVGIWVVAGLVSPGAISALIHNFVWGWAIEWTFFVVEIVAALVYYATWDRISQRTHVAIGWLYFAAAYLSLVIINGIITFMLTPGRWIETQAFWDGFFNPTYWPSLVLRTGICAMMATAFLALLVGRAAPESRPRLHRYLGLWLVGGALISYAGYRWWEAALPETVLGLFRGDAPILPTLAATRSLALWALTAALAVGGLLLVALPRAGRPAVAVLVAIAAFTFFGAYERLREGVRKPYLIHGYLYSNGLRVEDVPRVNQIGMAALSGWVAGASADVPVERGRAIFQAQCASCHTLDGYQGIRPLLPTTEDMLALAADAPAGSGERAFRTACASCHPDATFEQMRDVVPAAAEIRADPDSIRQLNSMMIAATLEKLRAGTFRPMPPLVGSDTDAEALAAYLASLESEGRD